MTTTNGAVYFRQGVFSYIFFAPFLLKVIARSSDKNFVSSDHRTSLFFTAQRQAKARGERGGKRSFS